MSVIRRLAAGDESTLQEACRRYKARVPSDEEAAHVLSLDDLLVWVAEVDGELAGFAYAHELPRIDGATTVFLYELEVDERFRQRGIGRALVEEANRLAGARRMFVLTGHDNEPAQRTYSAAGGSAASELIYRWR
jgi:ribosomal protein S18 acetylase RimI-like enzyme